MISRKVLAGVLAFAVLAGAAALPVQTGAYCGVLTAYAQTSGDYEYEDTDGGVRITAYNGEASELNIPGSLDGKTVKAIGEGAFSSAGLTKVNIPSGVEVIGADAFSFCEGLYSVSLPDTVRTIDVCAFSGCALKSVSIPDSVQTIAEGAFLDNTELSEVSLPDKGITVESEAFHNCTALTSVTIPKNVSEIGSRAFGFCDDEEGSPVRVSGFRIKCYTNSAAHKYAKKNSLERELLDPDTKNLTDIDEENFIIVPEDKKVSGNILGDVDGDGEVTINDAVMVIASVNGNFALDERGERLGDCDMDGAVDVTDSVMIISHINGIKPLGEYVETH